MGNHNAARERSISGINLEIIALLRNTDILMSMFNWIFDLISGFENLIYKSDRSTQLFIAVIAAGVALYNAWSIFGMFTDIDTGFASTDIVLTGAIAITAGYIAIISVVGFSQNSYRRHHDEIVARERAIHDRKNDKL